MKTAYEVHDRSLTVGIIPDFSTDGRHLDRVVSTEMFAHMRN